jgi:hypothetical protein
LLITHHGLHVLFDCKTNHGGSANAAVVCLIYACGVPDEYQNAGEISSAGVVVYQGDHGVAALRSLRIYSAFNGRTASAARS